MRLFVSPWHEVIGFLSDVISYVPVTYTFHLYVLSGPRVGLAKGPASCGDGDCGGDGGCVPHGFGWG